CTRTCPPVTVVFATFPFASNRSNGMPGEPASTIVAVAPYRLAGAFRSSSGSSRSRVEGDGRPARRAGRPNRNRARGAGMGHDLGMKDGFRREITGIINTARGEFKELPARSGVGGG